MHLSLLLHDAQDWIESLANSREYNPDAYFQIDTGPMCVQNTPIRFIKRQLEMLDNTL